MSSEPVVAVLGRGLVPADTPLFTAFDFGVTRGDGCFDVIRVTRQADQTRADHFEEHLARFARSAAALGLSVDLDEWRTLAEQALAAWHEPGEAVLKLVLTRGPEFAGPPVPTGVATIAPTPDVSAKRRGIAVVTVNRGCPSGAFADSPWLLGGVKTLSYAVNQAVKRESAARGAADAIFVSTDGYLLEGPSTGLVVEWDDALWTTPRDDSGVLASVTVDVALRALAAEGWRTGQRFFTAAELPHARGAWLMSCSAGVMPILSLDGVPVPQDSALTVRLAQVTGF